MSNRMEGVLKRLTRSRLTIRVNGIEYPCTQGMFENVVRHFVVGERVEIELNSQGQVKSVVSRESVK